ncbi:hypothetical protein RB594_009515 [Gaeumannomyces avenae]
MRKRSGSGAFGACAILRLGLLVARYGAQADPETVTGKLSDAAVITNNPPAMAVAQWKASDDKPFHGSVIAFSSPDGTGVFFQVNFRNLPTDTGGEYEYHIHDQPVPSDGNCNGTLAHLDPYERGQEIPCDKDKPETCQVGDLSGKHGKVAAPDFEFKRYREIYASLAPGIGAFFGNRSVVIHFPNSTRFMCANFTEQGFSLDEMGIDGPRFESWGPGMWGGSGRPGSGWGGPPGGWPGGGNGRGGGRGGGGPGGPGGGGWGSPAEGGGWGGPGSGSQPPSGRPWYRSLRMTRAWW